jgi:exodeoxyribonuclease VII small subunit
MTTEDVDGIGYGAALDELQLILDELEGSAVDVDRLATRVARAAVLINVCRSRISAARLEVETVMADLDSSE